MVKVEVDYNNRDRQGRVVARVPAAMLGELRTGEAVLLRDPVENLQADAVVAELAPQFSRASFSVDWKSFREPA